MLILTSLSSDTQIDHFTHLLDFASTLRLFMFEIRLDMDLRFVTFWPTNGHAEHTRCQRSGNFGFHGVFLVVFGVGTRQTDSVTEP